LENMPGKEKQKKKTGETKIPSGRKGNCFLSEESLQSLDKQQGSFPGAILKGKTRVQGEAGRVGGA